jgi:hypothetical protein
MRKKPLFSEKNAKAHKFFVIGEVSQLAEDYRRMYTLIPALPGLKIDFVIVLTILP